MNHLERKLRWLVDAVLDECGQNPRFASRIARALESGEEPPARESARPRGKRPAGELDPFEVYGDGNEATLRSRLQQLDEEQLKDIIAEHSMDNSRLAMKWKSKDRLVEFILEKVVHRTRKGSAFLKEDFRVRASEAEFVKDWDAVLVPVELVNRGPADTVTSIHLRVEEDSFANSIPDAHCEVPQMIGSAPRRFESNDGVSGILYFGPGEGGGRAVPPTSKADLVIQLASGAIHRKRIAIRQRSAT